ncbi:AFG1 ATPase-domain-containing protein [Salix suchowensis]|nr:AFG1 ATPase-domain-containing protein [Salix suchowensis]
MFSRAFQYLHLFLHARSLLSASVRLNEVGPYGAQQLLLHAVRPLVEAETSRCRNKKTGILDEEFDELNAGPATTWPLGEILAGRHDLQHSRIFNTTRRLISSSSIPRHVVARSRNSAFIRRASLSTLTKNRVPRDVSNHSKVCNSTLAEASTSSTPLPASLLKQSSDNGTEHHTKIFKALSDISFRSQRSRRAGSPPNIPKGLYLYGDVGTGKTMLMDLFYQTLPSNMTRKRRVHFHAFMIDVHKRVHEAKKAMGYRGGDPILPVARDLANEACVLCFDEFQVTDIADAMILRRLLENLMKFGVVMVMTSKYVLDPLGHSCALSGFLHSRHPDDLYKNGIQRSSFVPAIELIKSQIEVTDLNSGTGMYNCWQSRID